MSHMGITDIQRRHVLEIVLAYGAFAEELPGLHPPDYNLFVRQLIQGAHDMQRYHSSALVFLNISLWLRQRLPEVRPTPSLRVSPTYPLCLC